MLNKKSYFLAGFHKKFSCRQILFNFELFLHKCHHLQKINLPDFHCFSKFIQVLKSADLQLIRQIFHKKPEKARRAPDFVVIRRNFLY